MSRLDDAALGTIAQRMLADYDGANPGTVFDEGLRLETLEAGQRLEKGDLILTGAFGPPIPLGDKVRVDVTSSAFGNVSASFI